MTRSNRTDHIRITSHPAPGAKLEFPIHWGAATARERGPIIGTVSRPQDRNVIGTHSGSYSIYRALAVSSGALDPIRRPDLTNTHPAATIGPFPQWSEPERIVSLDPWGHLAAENLASKSPRAPTSVRASRSPARGSICRNCRPRSTPGGSSTTATSFTRTAASPSSRSRSTRCGICRDLPRASPPPKTICAGNCSSRPPACFPSW